jgi:Ca-activated chloride channel homolog
MKRFLSSFLLAALCLAPVTGEGAGLIIVTDPDILILPPPQPPRPPHPPIPPPRPMPPPRPYVFAPLELVSQQVNVRILDQVAMTTVEQEFYNPNSRQLEGTFLFPVPKGAQINKFAMDIGGRMMEAELLDADKARKIYEDIVRSMKDPALLEYAGQGLYKARIFPIEPHSRKRVTLTYTQLLPADAGLVSYAYPLGAGKYSSQPVRSLGVKIELETKRPLKTIYSPSHSVEVRRQGERKASIGFEANNVKPEGDLQLVFATDKDDIGLNLMTYRKGNEDGFFLLLASPGVNVDAKNVVSKDVVFVLDTSGSMAGAKLEQAKKAMLFCVENLNAQDRFEVLRFSTDAETLFNGLTEAKRDNRSRAEDFIKDLKPTGGTAIHDALQKALALRPADSERPFVVIFLTDGRPTVGVTDEDQIVASVSGEKAARTRIFCFGIGTDVNTHLLDKVAEKTRAFSQYVLPTEDIEVKVSSFFAKIKDPVLANPQIAFKGGVRVSKLYPSPLPDLFKGEQLVLAGRFSGSGDSAIELTGLVNGKEQKLTYEATFASESREHDFIPRLWATRRVGFLLDEIRLRGESKELRDEVVELARAFNIVTPYTAYLIVEDEQRRNVPVAAQTLPRLQEDRVAREVAADAYRRQNLDRSGDAAVAGARGGLALKSAESATRALSVGQDEARRSLEYVAQPAPAASGPASVVARERAESVGRLVGYTQQSRFVRGKSFYQSGDQWVDADSQSMSKERPIEVRFGSDEYFGLLKKSPEVAALLSLGRNVLFALEGRLYKVTE